ncbi:MarR family transcriptional regulator [Streptomyces gardneri]|uniref:MarR family winged helix-turn-helix transcriptional regulator n=1 Tax=Nocardia TaxID=1817 RepID=UPI00135ADED7|nr:MULTISPECIES: MarR family transcriptional regulator [Nocardia]MBF6163370.1 MarR family transcriptional regulator [Streptomyces gardneri]MBF6202661.1 MarR family transcriptional regulator [Streptomyces gardneri]UAK35222.1 MarR family transcriptional regulator [Nocardia asteroides]
MTRQPDPVVDTELDRDVCKLVHRFTHRLDVHVRRVAEQLDLTPSQVIALRELSEAITARELAARMSCEPSNATFVLDRLEQQGLVRREPHPTDRRAKQIVLTPAGQRRRDDALELLGANSPLTALTEAQQEALRDLLLTMATDTEG